MSEMAERIAKEFAAEFMHLTARQRKSFKYPDDANGDTIDHAMAATCRAVATMREPTDAMVAAAMAPYRHEIDDKMRAAFDQTIRGYWRSMIDEILK